MQENKNEVQQMLELLVEKGWTLAAIADQLGCRRGTVSRWRSGSFIPDYPRVVVLALENLAQRKRIPKQRRYPPGYRTKAADVGESEETAIKTPLPALSQQGGTPNTS